MASSDTDWGSVAHVKFANYSWSLLGTSRVTVIISEDIFLQSEVEYRVNFLGVCPLTLVCYSVR